MISAICEYFVEPNDGVLNEGYDNKYGVLIVAKDQKIKGPDGSYFRIVSPLGNGQFGNVFQVECISDNSISPTVYAMKITRSQETYRKQANHEIEVHKIIQEYATPEERKSIITMITAFEYHNHVCIVNEYLSMDLYQVLKRREFNGLPINLVRSLLRQLLNDLVVLKRLNIIHGDIKPENIMLVDGYSPNIKLIDFGSAKLAGNWGDFYFQSRYYRAPEVVLHLQYDYKVDVWSVACVAIEMFIGNPIFAGQNELHLLQLISRYDQNIPHSMIKNSPIRNEFFNKDYTFKTLNQYCYENDLPVPEFHDYLLYHTIPEVIMNYQMPATIKHGPALQREKGRREQFINLMLKMLTVDPKLRPEPEKCLEDPFFSSG